jgi:predicted transcriptional regulator
MSQHMIRDIRDIRRARKAVEWTQKDLADATELSQSAIAKIEKGRYGVSHETFCRIAEALEIKSQEAGDCLTLGDIMETDIITMAPEEPVEKAVRLMNEHSISQIPLFEGNSHIGTVTSTGLAVALTQDPGIRTVGKAMARELPMLNESAQVNRAITALLEEFHAILVTRSGEVVGIVTSEDVLKRSVREHYNV